jgi:hypothetical protein
MEDSASDAAYFFPSIPGWQKSLDHVFSVFELSGSLSFDDFKRVWRDASLSRIFNIGNSVCAEGHKPEDYRRLFIQCLYASALNSDVDTGSDTSAAAKTFALVIIYKMPPPLLPVFSAVDPRNCRVPIPLTPRHSPYITRMMHIVRFSLHSANYFLYPQPTLPSSAATFHISCHFSHFLPLFTFLATFHFSHLLPLFSSAATFHIPCVRFAVTPSVSPMLLSLSVFSIRKVLS